MKIKKVLEEGMIGERCQSLADWKQELELLFEKKQGSILSPIDETSLNKLEKQVSEIRELFDLNLTSKEEFKLGQQSCDINVLLKFVNSDPSLKRTMEPLLKVNSEHHAEQFRQRFVTLLVKVFEKQMSEHGHLNLTQDGHRPWQASALPVIDSYLAKQTALSMLETILPQLLFSFAYLALVEIEDLFVQFS